jgi:hypothetical protein
MTRQILAAVLVALGLGGCTAQIGDRSVQNEPPGPGKGGTMSPGGGNGGGAPSGPPGYDPGPGPVVRGDAGASADGAPANFCAQLIPISAPSFQDLPAGPGFKLRVRVQPGDATAPPTSWTWSAVHGDGLGTDVPVTSLDPQNTEVELPIEKEGLYQLSASASVRTVPCTATAIAFATASERRLGQYRVRLTPPAGKFPVQETQVQVMAGKPLNQVLMLQQGQPVTFQPRDEAGTHGIASYVRVSQLGSSLAVEGHTGHADFKPPLLAVLRYDVLFVPDEEIAPYVVLGQTPAMLNVLPQKLSPGAALTGKLVDGGGAPLRDGRVILRAGPLTSTVGASDVTGAFALRVRAGQFALTASPPPASGLPELTLAPENGLTIGEVPAAGTIEVKWAAITPAPVGLLITSAAGPPAVGARVRLERVEPLAAAGTMSYTPPSGAPVNRPIPGYVKVTGQVAADGTSNLPPVPPGSYRLLIIPSDADRTSALTSVALDVPAGGVSGKMVKLSTRARLRGTLLPAEAAGTRIYATPQEMDPPRPVAAGVVGPGGSYQLEVDPGRDYVIWADPGAGKPLSRVQLARVLDAADGAQVPDRTLPRALAFTGGVRGDDNNVLPNVVVQVYCDMAAPSCLDSSIALGEAVSDKGGMVTLYLPDPGAI